METREKKFLTPKELAERLGCSPDTLDEWRRRGKGPRFLQPFPRCRIRYPLVEVEVFERQLKRHSAS